MSPQQQGSRSHAVSELSIDKMNACCDAIILDDDDLIE
jgi:hypothetical protein